VPSLRDSGFWGLFRATELSSLRDLIRGNKEEIRKKMNKSLQIDILDIKFCIMADSYTQLYVQMVFVVKNRGCLIREDFREKLERYICGIVRKHNSKPLAIYCNPDHTHLLAGLNPAISISDLVKSIKSNSSRWINEMNFLSTNFRWQKGYGAFSYSRSHLNRVADYIAMQPAHHKKKTFKEEYLQFLKEYEIPFNEEYLFDWIAL